MARKNLAALILAILVLAPVDAASASALSRSEVLRILEVPEGFTPLSASLDLTKPLKPGDSFAFVQDLYTWAGTKPGKRIGHLDGACQVVSAVSASGAGKAYCIAHAFLPAGQILIQGFQPFTAGLGRYVYPVTGGTGRYSSTRGWVAIRDLSETGKTADVFHLVT
jgi:hypothetical protein